MFSTKTQSNTKTATKKTATNKTTEIKVHFDAGYSNNLYIRGEGANLNWNKGVPLKNVSANEWIWETDKPFSYCEYKILVNDYDYEKGGNRSIKCGSTQDVSPQF